MSIVRTSDVFCDIGKPGCLGWASDCSATDGLESHPADVARARAKHDGWVLRTGRDICPECQKSTL